MYLFTNVITEIIFVSNMCRTKI